jgi:hypothetical protein
VSCVFRLLGLMFVGSVSYTLAMGCTRRVRVARMPKPAPKPRCVDEARIIASDHELMVLNAPGTVVHACTEDIRCIFRLEASLNFRAFGDRAWD